MVSSQTESIHVRMTEIVENLKTLNESQKRVEKAVGKLVDEEQGRRQTFTFTADTLTSYFQ